jgi:DNA repair protein RadA/Sms
MAKTTARHRCFECDATSARWAGRCPSCGAWNTLVEEAALHPLAAAVDELELCGTPVPLGEVDPTEAAAVPTGIEELDRVLSGGLVPGSVTLLGGEPGIGKSTLVLQALAARAAAGHRVLLISAEESAHQVRLRAERLGPVPPGLLILATTDLTAAIRAVVETEPDLVGIDSIQALTPDDAGSGERRGAGAHGSVARVRACAEQLTRVAKAQQVATVLVGHVTKDGALAGPRALEHMVDTVLSFEGDRHHALRLLTAVKHRFGPSGELGLFEMGECGLEPVDDPGRLLLADRREGAPGVVLLPALQGRRTLVVELQALVTPAGSGKPVRSGVGIEGSRLAIVLAVLAKEIELDLSNADVFVSVVGGVRVTEPAADVAIALAVVSAALKFAIPSGLAAAGEIGLAGEIRRVTHLPRRLEELARVDCEHAIVPASAPDGPAGLELLRSVSVREAIIALAKVAVSSRATAVPDDRLLLAPPSQRGSPLAGQVRFPREHPSEPGAQRRARSGGTGAASA